MSTGGATSGEFQVRHAARLRQLHEIFLKAQPSLDDLYADCLEAGRRALGLASGAIGRIDGEHHRILASLGPGARPGDTLPLADGGCGEVARRGEVAASHAEASIGAPLWVDDKLFGTLCFTDANPRPQPFAPEDLEFVELMGRALGRAIGDDRLDRRRREADRIRSESIALFGTAFTHAPIGMAMVGLDGRWLRVNAALCRLVGYSEPELLALDFQSITFPDDLNSDLRLVARLLKGAIAQYQIEKRYIRKDGKVIWTLLNVSLVRNDNGTPRYFVSQIQDIHERKELVVELERRGQQLEEANRKLAELATTDPLTGLLNRRAFNEALEREIDRARREGGSLAVMMLDVDHFKAYNDRHGHIAGDAMLTAVAQRLKQSVRPYDKIARYGGEEFIALFPGVDRQAAAAIGERVCQAIASLGEDGGVTVSVGVHAGGPIAGDAGAGAEADRLVDSADRALYRAKERGRNRVEVA